MNIALVDLNGQVSDIFGNDELLGVRANVYLSFQGLEHPVDSLRIFSGTISSVSQTAGLWKLKVDNPDKLKDQTLFIPYSDILVNGSDNIETELTVIDTTNLIGAGGKLSTYVRIDDEIMLVSSFTSTVLTVTRGALGSIATWHDSDADISSVYRLQGNPIDLALELMLSAKNIASYLTDEVLSIDTNGNLGTDIYNIADSQGVVIGDAAEVTGSIGYDGSYIVSSIGLTTYTLSPAIPETAFLNGMTVDFFTQYNTLPEGCALYPDEVDIEQHLFIKDTFGGSFPAVDFLLTEEMKVKTWLETEILLPLGAYFLTRKGRISAGYTAASIASNQTIELNSSNVSNPTTITPKRTISEYFYNSIIHKFNYDLLREKFLNIIISQSEESLTRIRQGAKTLTIEANGFLGNANTISFFNDVSLRILDRYRLAATSLTVTPLYGVALNMEVGDSVVFNGEGLQIFDSLTGNSDSFLRVMEIVNKSLDVTSGKITLKLLDTNYGVNDRYTVVSPSSPVALGSTTERIKIKKGTYTPELDSEFEKWSTFTGASIKIHSSDFTYNEDTILRGVDPADNNFLLVDALSIAPSEDSVVCLSDYDLTRDGEKLLYPYIGYSEPIISGISDTEFTVADASNLFVGDVVQVHNEDFSQFNTEVIIEEVDGVLITVSGMGFTPGINSRVEGGFISDSGGKYVFF